MDAFDPLGRSYSSGHDVLIYEDKGYWYAVCQCNRFSIRCNKEKVAFARAAIHQDEEVHLERRG